MKKLNLHIGPHKTATTHMQNVLERSTYQPGTEFVPLWKVRKTLSSNLNHNQPPGDVGYLDHEGTLLISEENFCGFPPAGVKLYPRIADIVTYFRDFDATVYFSPRHYATFVPSVYCESLRHAKYFRFPEDVTERSWIDVLKDVEDALPKANIKLWFYEDYRSHWQQIMQYFADGQLIEFGEPPKSDPRSTLSQKAINTYAALQEFVTEPNPVLTVLGDAFPTGVSNPKFAPFNMAAIEALTVRYRADCEVLAQRYDVFRPQAAVETAGAPA